MYYDSQVFCLSDVTESGLHLQQPFYSVNSLLKTHSSFDIKMMVKSNATEIVYKSCLRSTRANQHSKSSTISIKESWICSSYQVVDLKYNFNVTTFHRHFYVKTIAPTFSCIIFYLQLVCSMHSHKIHTTTVSNTLSSVASHSIYSCQRI